MIDQPAAHRARRARLGAWAAGVRAGLAGVGLCAVALGAPAAAAREPVLQRFSFSEPHMGTLARLTIHAASRAEARAGADAAFARITALDATLSDYRADSELMRLSRRAGEGPGPVGPDLFAVLEAAQQLAARTDGAFDVTSGTLTRVWRGARRLGELPDIARVEAARATAGYRLLTLDRASRTVQLARSGMRLDVGGIAKGYAVDEALEVLRARGLPRALAALGGDIAVGDPPPGAPGWSVAIERVAIDGAPDLGPLMLSHAAVSTAGDAEQWMTANGLRYSHILDPRTGQPMTGRSSTTVVASTGLEADGLDTALAVVGPEAGLAMVNATPGAAAVWVVEGADGRAVVTRSSRWLAPAETTTTRKE